MSGNLENVSSYTNKNQAPNVNDLTFSSPDLSSFYQRNNLGLVATGQHLCAEHAVIECRFTKAPEPCPSARLLVFHEVRSTDILPIRLTGNGQPNCCYVFVAGVVLAAVSGMKTPAVLRRHAQSFPVGRYAEGWQPSCWMACRYPALRTIWTLPSTPSITLLSTKVSACFLMTRSGLTV